LCTYIYIPQTNNNLISDQFNEQETYEYTWVPVLAFSAYYKSNLQPSVKTGAVPSSEIIYKNRLYGIQFSNYIPVTYRVVISTTDIGNCRDEIELFGSKNNANRFTKNTVEYKNRYEASGSVSCSSGDILTFYAETQCVNPFSGNIVFSK
jgi:hypothetical protein